MHGADDASLVRRAQAGDMMAFTDLIDRHERTVYNLTFRLMGNHADAADAAQEALIVLYWRLRRYHGYASFSTWLFRVTRRIDGHHVALYLEDRVRDVLSLRHPDSAAQPAGHRHSRCGAQVVIRG